MSAIEPDAPNAPAIALTGDGALALGGSGAALAACEGWIPFGRGHAVRPASSIHVELSTAGGADRAAEGSPATFTLGGVSVRVSGDHASLRDAGVTGEISLGGGEARLRVPGGDDDGAVLARRSALTAAAALLLGRLGRALVHAGAAVHPTSGGAWLLVGDTHSGKSTTVANLAQAGWAVLADDTVALFRDGADVMIEGWPRTMHLDAGWGTPSPTGRRVACDPRAVLASSASAAPARLAGILFPRVEAAGPTAARPRTGADALAMLLRQSPWLFADSAAAPPVLELLREAAGMPAATLALGLDSFHDPRRLDSVVRAVTG